MQIDIFHDTVCPWCRIGKANLTAALKQLESAGTPVSVDIRYHTFFLNPEVPPEGAKFRDMMNAKTGGRVPLEAFFDAPRKAGEAVGLTFNFEKIEHAPNTVLSHRLIALTPPEQKVAMIDAIYAAYFENGENIGDLDILVNIASALGMDAAEVRHTLQSDVLHAEVVNEAAMAQQMGVTGVPLFVFDNMFALSGAQPVPTMIQVLKQVAGQLVKIG